MRARATVQVALVVCLFIAVAGVRPPQLALASCAAPVTPGTWTGTFNRTITAQGTDRRDRIHPRTTQFLETVTGNLALKVGCDGTVTGRLTNENLALQIAVVVTNTISNKSATFNSSCTGAGGAAVNSGSVAANAGGLPVFALNITVAWDGFACSDVELQRLYNQSGGGAGYSATVTLTANSASATAIGGAVWESSDLPTNAALNDLRGRGLPPTIVTA